MKFLLVPGSRTVKDKQPTVCSLVKLGPKSGPKVQALPELSSQFRDFLRDAIIKENPIKSGFLQITFTPICYLLRPIVWHT